MTETRMFMGIPISGDIERNSRRTTVQRPKNELGLLVQALTDDVDIVEFGWHQYTPFFNDGDVCEFSVYDLWVQTRWDAERDEDDPEQRYVSDYHPTLAENTYTDIPTGRFDQDRWGRHYEVKETITSVNPHYDADRLERCKALDSAISSGAFDNALMDLFGDHANITVRRDGITVDYYDHD